MSQESLQGCVHGHKPVGSPPAAIIHSHDLSRADALSDIHGPCTLIGSRVTCSLYSNYFPSSRQTCSWSCHQVLLPSPSCWFDGPKSNAVICFLPRLSLPPLNPVSWPPNWVYSGSGVQSPSIAGCTDWRLLVGTQSPTIILMC